MMGRRLRCSFNSDLPCIPRYDSVIETFNGRIVVSECSATIIVKYLDWIESEVKNEIEQIDTIVEDER